MPFRPAKQNIRYNWIGQFQNYDFAPKFSLASRHNHWPIPKFILSIECVFLINLSAQFSLQSINLYQDFQLFYCPVPFIVLEGKQKKYICHKSCTFCHFCWFSRPIRNKKQEKLAKFLWSSKKCTDFFNNFKKQTYFNDMSKKNCTFYWQIMCNLHLNFSKKHKFETVFTRFYTRRFQLHSPKQIDSRHFVPSPSSLRTEEKTINTA